MSKWFKSLFTRKKYTPDEVMSVISKEVLRQFNGATNPYKEKFNNTVEEGVMDIFYKIDKDILEGIRNKKDWPKHEQ